MLHSPLQVGPEVGGGRDGADAEADSGSPLVLSPEYITNWWSAGRTEVWTKRHLDEFPAGAGEGGGGQAGRGEPLCLGDLSAVDPATRCRPPWLQQAGVLPAGPRGGAEQPGPGRPESAPAGRAGRPHQLRQDAAGARGPADPKLVSLEAAVNCKNVDNTAYKIKNYI